MQHPIRKIRKRRTLVSFARSVTILALITCIASLLFLETTIRAAYGSRYGFFIGLGPGISLVDIVVNLRHCVWVGLLLAPMVHDRPEVIVGRLYTQAKLPRRQAKRILRVITIVESGYLLLSLCAAVYIGWIIWAWSS